MAIQDTSLSAAEHDYYATRSGEPSNAPLSQHKRVYIQAKTGSVDNNIIELEKTYLKFLMNSNLNNLPGLWARIASVVNLPVSKNMNENKRQYYINNVEPTP